MYLNSSLLILVVLLTRQYLIETLNFEIIFNLSMEANIVLRMEELVQPKGSLHTCRFRFLGLMNLIFH